MPEFQKEYDHYEREFGKSAMGLMNWPAPGEGAADAIYHFSKTGGQMLRAGHYEEKKGMLHDVDSGMADDTPIVGDLKFHTISGVTSIVTLEVVPESKSSIRMIIQKHDMRLLSEQGDVKIPDSTMVRDGEGAVLTSHYFIIKTMGCGDPEVAITCTKNLEFFPTRTFLRRAP